MLAHIQTAALSGIDAFAVSVEVDVSFGLPFFAMVGLPDASVRESRDRVRAAIRNSGFEFPAHRITVNLSPADVRKAGTAFDLPIAIAILGAAGVVPRHDASRLAVVGELSLDGAVLPARGILPLAAGLRRHGIDALMLPAPNAGEAAVVEGLRVVPVRTLAEAAECLTRRSRSVAVSRALRANATVDECGRRTRLGRPEGPGRRPARPRGRRGRRASPAASWVHLARARPCWRDASQGFCRR